MYQIDFDRPVNVYFIGIGGISMSGLAMILKNRGFSVAGSDRSASSITEGLEKDGIHVDIGQRRENITEDIDLLVYTAAIHPDNPEYVRALELGIPMLTRAELLGQIMKGYDLPVAISGTHGKTTTTGMISDILLCSEKDPTISIGGILKSINGNVRVGGPQYFVAEACEYTNSFLSMFPKVGIILDIDADHLDFFKGLDDIRHSFRLFAELLPEDGTLIINSDIPDVLEISKDLPCKVLYFGSDPAKSDYYPEDITYDGNARPSFTLCRKTEDGVEKQRFTLHVSGEHNVYNSLSAVAAADLMGISRDVTKAALLSYQGTGRRFEYKGMMDGVTIIDDYAHHPTEIAATLNAARKMAKGEIWCAFQPHTYTRTKALMDDFAKALTLADHVVLAKIYAARETDDLGISSDTLCGKIRDLGGDCVSLPTFEEIEIFLRKNCRKDDVLITMGAGNIDTVGEDLLSE